KGNYGGVPLSAEGRRVADSWDPANDEAAGEQCKSYGAAGLMRMPGHLHITWQDDNTLRIDTDAGTQTRVLHVGGAPSGSATGPVDRARECVCVEVRLPCALSRPWPRRSGRDLLGNQQGMVCARVRRIDTARAAAGSRNRHADHLAASLSDGAQRESQARCLV